MIASASRPRPPASPPLIEREDADRIDQLLDDRNFLTGATSVPAAHVMGGAATGLSSGDLDDRLVGGERAHGIPWLRVADSGLFPDSVEIGPYVTRISPVERAAEAIRAEPGS